MKKHTMNFAHLRRGAAKWVLAAIIVAATVTTQAQSGSALDNPDKNASIKYIGGENDQQSFTVSYPNEDGNRFALSIADGAGYKLYQGIYTEKNFNKVFTIPGLNEGKLIFTFRDYKTNLSQTYEVNTSTRKYQEVKVKKIS